MYNVDKMGTDVFTNHMIYSQQVLESEKEKLLKVKQSNKEKSHSRIMALCMV